MGRLTDDDFTRVFTSRALSLRRTAYLLCGDWSRAEDLVQTTFARTYAAWGRIKDPAAVDSYLRTTLARVYLDDARRKWSGEVPTAVLPDECEDPNAASIDDRVSVLAALAAIPPRQRACVVMRFVDDCSVSETARVLGCSEGTVKSNTARGLAALRAHVGNIATRSEEAGHDSRH
jgi:RNA polymerase sigma-70 factor (sigma-E family)